MIGKNIFQYNILEKFPKKSGQGREGGISSLIKTYNKLIPQRGRSRI